MAKDKKVSEKANKPVYSAKDFPVSLSVWKKDIKVDKKTVTVYNTTAVKTYKDEDDEYQNTSSFNEQDLLKLSNLSMRVYNWILLSKQKDYENSKGEDEEEEEEDE